MMTLDSRTYLGALVAALVVAFISTGCGGKATEGENPSGTDAGADTGSEASPDTGSDAVDEALPDDTAAPDGPVDYATCFGADGNSPQWAITLCTGACEVVEHQKDCCGTIVLIGISPSERTLFEACEAAWRASLPECGCAQGPTEVQVPAGTTVDSPDQAVAQCVNWTSSGGICQTSKLP